MCAQPRADADVVVIDAKNHHTFQPLLYQVATAALSPAAIAWPIRHLLSDQANARVLMSQVVGVEAEARQVVTASGETIAYDQLVIAAGAAHSYFGHDDTWSPYAPGLKTLEDALEMRRRILSAFERAELAGRGEAAPSLTSFVVVGGGPTGVELAGAIAEIARDALKSEFRHIDPAASRIVLVEAGPRILPTFPERLAADAARRLARYGVEVMTGATVMDIDAAGVALEDGRIDAATVLWAAGVRAGAADLRLAGRARSGRTGARGRGPVAAGPSRHFRHRRRRRGELAGRDAPVPGIAPAAKQMGAYVGQVIARRLSGRPAPPPFRYQRRRRSGHHRPGRGGGEARPVAADRAARLAVLGLHPHLFPDRRARRFFVALDWPWSYVTYHRGARLITHP